MCRMVGWVSAEPVTARALLGDAAIERLRLLSAVHCHGWGMAWRAGDGVQVHRASSPAKDDRDFARIVDDLPVRSAVLHLRMGTPGYGRGVADTHPFADDTWALIHNGAVAPTAQVDELLTADSSRRPLGSTDSERWFLALRDEIDRGRPVPEAVTVVIQRAHAAGLHASSWNSMLLGPDALHVVNDHDHALLPTDIALWPAEVPKEIVCWPPYFDLRIRRRHGAAVVMSSGIVDDVAEWTLLPTRSVTRLPLDGGRPRTTMLDERAARPAISAPATC
jgi:predicted glutamine amidotransferase